MGRVYLGLSPGGRHVAIKAIRAELAENADFRNRFTREVAAARRVSGVFTASVVDADLDGPVPWLATSYVAGPSLADAVAESGPLPAGTVLALAAGLAEGLNAIHAAGVVHRDLKPSNVILAQDGPCILDFGISRSAEASALTQTGMVVGSPGFMSPEQAEGHEVGPASDIFSLGAVLAFAAMGEGPFGAGSTPALVYRVVYSEPSTDKLPDEIRPLVERCLDKDPQHRPTAAQLLAELSAVRPAPGPLPAPVIHRKGQDSGRAPRETTGPITPVHPATERAAVPATWPPGAPAWPATVTAGNVQPPVAPGPGPVRRRRSLWVWLIAGAAVLVLAGTAAGAFLASRAGQVSNRAPATPAAVSRHANSAGSTTPAARSPSSTPSPTGPPGAAVMSSLASYLAQSASVRPSIQAAINGVQTCSQSPSTGKATLQQAINTRQNIVTGLQSLSPADLPNGAQLISELTAAMQNSITADRDYQNWMADFANAGSPCGSDPNQDSSYTAGQNASVQATAAKNTFLSIWNPMAPSYGQKTYSSTDF